MIISYLIIRLNVQKRKLSGCLDMGAQGLAFRPCALFLALSINRDPSFTEGSFSHSDPFLEFLAA